MSTGAPTVRSLDERTDRQEKDFTAFKSRVEVVISLQKWLGMFMVATLVAVISHLLSISFAADKLEKQVEINGTEIQELKQEVSSLKKEVRQEISDLKKEIKQDISD